MKGPSLFQHVASELNGDLEFCEVYIDDVLTFFKLGDGRHRSCHSRVGAQQTDCVIAKDAKVMFSNERGLIPWPRSLMGKIKTG